MAEIVEQPDFAAVRSDFENLGRISDNIGRQLGRCENLPAIGAANTIIQQLAAVLDKLEAIKNDNVKMRKQLAASNFNAVARAMNAHPPRGQPLHQLRAVDTNEEIPNFPQHLEDIAKMTSADLISVLRALDQPVVGQVAEKRKRLEAAIGFAFQM
ncbi:hypothetical protein RB597_007951 [Gaeumannomyces tritici]